MRNGIKWLVNLWGSNQAKEAYKAWQMVFDCTKPEVAKVLRDLAIYCNVYNSSFNSTNSEQTAFNEGARDVFLHIMEMLGLDYNELCTIANGFIANSAMANSKDGEYNDKFNR